MKTKVQKGEAIGKEDSNGIVLIVMKWQDTHNVCLLTTKHGLDMVSVQKKTCKPMAATSPSGDQRAKTKGKPVAVVDYT